jgi:hypothetical protein
MNCEINIDHLSSETKNIKIFGNSETLQQELALIGGNHNLHVWVIAIGAGRILESLLKRIIDDFKILVTRSDNQRPVTDDFLAALSAHEKIDRGTLMIANSIRNYGNDGRHGDQKIECEDKDIIIGLLQLFIEWFDQRKFSGKINSTSSSTISWTSKTSLLRELAYPVGTNLNSYIAIEENQKLILSQRYLAELAAEQVIDHCTEDVAMKFTKKIYDAFSKKSTRVKQMHALFFSRFDSPDDAISRLEDNLNEAIGNWRKDASHRSKKYYKDTFGILGGAYKRKWTATKNAEYLAKSSQWYNNGLKYFPNDYYLLINSSATSLWNNQPEESRAKANEALFSLSNIGFKLNNGDNCEGINYWVVATIAEAYLLANPNPKSEKVKYFYDQAKRLDNNGAKWGVTKAQLLEHLEKINNNNLNKVFAELIS